MSDLDFAGPRERFPDRRAAGRILAEHLRDFAGRDDVVVLGLPRGGIPVAYEIAQRLRAPLDVFVVRKLGLPGHPELAMGAIATGGIRVLNEELVTQVRVPMAAIEAVTAAERLELGRRERLYRGVTPPIPVENRTVILVDDGLATGATMRAAVLALRRLFPSQVVVAVPVGSREACHALDTVADDVVCARMPEPFVAVGVWYQNFEQTADEEVRELLGTPAATSRVKRSA
jgi:predicted phosphoribosyltransferase